MPRSKTSARWLREHFTDAYVKQAQEAGYRSRAAFKLLEIQQRDRILHPGQTVVDLGAAPGGWSQVAASIVGSRGRVFALDVLTMDSLAGVTVLQGDFTENQVLEALLAQLGDARADLVMSDMAPNISGMRSVDQPRAMYLAELALALAQQVLRPGGDFLVKVFQGSGFQEFLAEMRAHFKKVSTRKPRASRPRSREVYLLGRGYNG